MSPDQAGLQLEILSQKRGRGGGVAREMIQSVKSLQGKCELRSPAPA